MAQKATARALIAAGLSVSAPALTLPAMADDTLTPYLSSGPEQMAMHLEIAEGQFAEWTDVNFGQIGIHRNGNVNGTIIQNMLSGVVRMDPDAPQAGVQSPFGGALSHANSGAAMGTLTIHGVMNQVTVTLPAQVPMGHGVIYRPKISQGGFVRPADSYTAVTFLIGGDLIIPLASNVNNEDTLSASMEVTYLPE